MTTETIKEFKKVCRPGTIDIGNWRASVFIKIDYDGKRLSISGVEGPLLTGNALGGCGQINMHLRAAQFQTFAPGWDTDTVAHLLEVWKRWHLNDMRAGCEHQRAEGWADRPIDPNKPMDTYGKHFDGQKQDSWNMLVWVRRDEHPEGLLCEPCPTCGYRYGTAWKHEVIPTDILDFLSILPDADKQPAWV